MTEATDELGKFLLVCMWVGEDDLECVARPQVGMARVVDNAHTAVAESPLQSVAVNERVARKRLRGGPPVVRTRANHVGEAAAA